MSYTYTSGKKTKSATTPCNYQGTNFTWTNSGKTATGALPSKHSGQNSGSLTSNDHTSFNGKALNGQTIVADPAHLTAAPIDFKFAIGDLAGLDLPALMTLTGTSTTASYTEAGGNAVQPGIAGQIIVTLIGNYNYTDGNGNPATLLNGTILLETSLVQGVNTVGNYSNASIISTGSTTGSLGTSNDATHDYLNFYSDVLNFGPHGQFVTAGNGFSFSLSGNQQISSLQTKGTHYTGTSNTTEYYNGLATFNSTFTGSFDALTVPETASWAMMITGMGLVGGAMRRRVKSA